MMVCGKYYRRDAGNDLDNDVNVLSWIVQSGFPVFVGIGSWIH